MASDRQVQLILTISTQCNQRCVYCYEHAGREDPARMELPQLEQLFHHIEAYYRSYRPLTIRFVWHGGEPLLAPPELLSHALTRQRSIFADPGYRLVNTLQSNLTVLDPARLALLQELDAVGTSLDVVGGLRVDDQGCCTEQQVIENLERLRAAGIWVSAICVLSQANLARLPEIYRFFREHRLQLRLLPLRSGTPAAADHLKLTAQEALAAFCQLADLWFEDDRGGVDAWPVTFLIGQLLSSRLTGFTPYQYDKQEWEQLFAIGVDGQLYGYYHHEDRRLAYGNVFTTPLEQILTSPQRHQAVVEAEQRLQACADCPYLGHACSGFPIAEGVEPAAEDGGELRCVTFAGLLRHLELRLMQAGFLEPATGRLTDNGRAAARSIRHNQEAGRSGIGWTSGDPPQ